MTDPILSYAKVMRAQIDRLDVVAQNASNTNSPGYLQQSAVSSNSFLSMVRADTEQPQQTVLHNRDLGSLKVTNRDTDFGMASDGWFVLDGGSLEVVTRNGRFSISQNGELQLNGYTLIGESGPVVNANGNLQVHSDGSLYSNGQYIDKLKIVSVGKSQALTSLGNGIYSVEGTTQIVEQPKIIQGALTGSNVSLESDMTKVIEITRHVEMLQRAMAAYNDILEIGINQIGK